MPPQAPSGPQRYDPNWFGTPEFMQLCKLSGGRPFLSVNVRSLTPQSFYEWVDYCNSPAGTTSLADARRADGSVAPYGVRYWGLGNEVWAAGGHLTAEEYAALYKRFTANVPSLGIDLALVASGPPPGRSTEWIRDFMRNCTSALLPIPIHAMSLHYYATQFLNELKPGQTLSDIDLRPENVARLVLHATEFGPDQWYQTLESSVRMDDMIDAYSQALDEFDDERRIKIAVDEWGAIYRRTPTRNVLNITGRGVTLRDALAASLTLDIFNKRCARLAVANFTGLINQEGGILLADGDEFCTTPVYHVFHMYAGHQGGRALRTLFDVPLLHREQSGETQPLARLSGSASVRENKLTLTVTNPHVSESHEAQIDLRGGEALSASVSTLTHSDIRAQNTFEDPEHLVPMTREFELRDSTFRHTFPAASVTSFTITLKGRGT
jgi:alpha-N-arabinofuranosidase